MSVRIHPTTPSPTPWAGALDRRFRSAILRRFRELRSGEIRLIEGDDERVFGQIDPAHPLRATLAVRDPRMYRWVALRGVNGAAEAYIEGLWTSDDLTALIRIFALEPSGFDDFGRGLASLGARVDRAWHWLRRNTRRGSRGNIAAHYDLGNDFFKLFLDPTLTYSCGIFEREDASMEEASIAKYDRACRKLEITRDDLVLEVGSGWGGFALYAAARYGCKVTTATISRRQYELARERVAKAGLEDRVQVVFSDYRDLEGTYDKLVSIEMIEAVGHKFFDAYFKACSDRLTDHGMMLLQAITVADQDYDHSVKSVDFIKRYVFPGGQLPSVEGVLRSVRKVTDLRVRHLEDISGHYAHTLRLWREKLFANLEQVHELGLPDRFIRLWEFYLRYCEAGFEERATGVVQMLFEKPKGRHEPVLGGLG